MNLDQLTLEQLHGNQRELAETIGIEAYKRLVLKYGGGNIYICKPDTLLQPLRDDAIYHHYNPPFCERHQSGMKKCFR